MGCGSSRQVQSAGTQPDAAVLTTPGGQIQPNRDAQGQSARTAGASSSPRQPSVRQRRSTSQSDTLSKHYNIPLAQPKPWKSKSRTWSPAQLHRERQEFFDTQVTGQSEIWDALRQVTECVRENDIATAQGLLDAVDCTLPTGQLEGGVYDQRGNLYRIPERIVSDPTNIVPDTDEVVNLPAESDISKEFLVEKDIEGETIANAETSTIDKGKTVLESDALKLRCRLTDRWNDIYVHCGLSQKIEVLALRIQQEAGIASKIRLFHLGKELSKGKTLEEQDFQESHIIQVFVCG